MTTIERRGHMRKGDGREPVPLGQLEAAFQEAAKLVVECGDQFLPLFERLEEEIDLRREKIAAVERARREVSRWKESGDASAEKSGPEAR